MDYKKYLRALKKTEFPRVACPHCAVRTASAKGEAGFCTFCEQSLSGKFSGAVGSATDKFKEIYEELAKGAEGRRLSGLDRLVNANSDQQTLYVSAMFYLAISDTDYLTRDYALPGFMEPNAARIEASVDFMSKGKGCLFRAAATAAEGQSAAQNRESLYIKFMSETKLGRLKEASATLAALADPKGKDPLSDYAQMVYGVTAGTKTAEKFLEPELKRKEPNAFYYLAEHLARKGRLGEAAEVLVQLGDKADVRMSAGLLQRIRDAQAASKV